jgi:hypothetical protein
MSERSCRMDCRVKPGNDDIESHSRGANAPELCRAIPKNELQSIKPERSARFGSERFGGFMRKKQLKESGTPPLNSSYALPRTKLGRSGRCGSAASNDRVGTALRAFAPPTLALFSDPQCQTATHPLVTTGSPAMTTRNCIAAMRVASGSASRKLASNGREAVSLLPKEGGGAPNGAPIQLPRRNAQARPGKRDRSPFGAPPRSCAGIPDSAWAALPGITGCKREDPLRHQCSEHLAVRSRAGRADTQTACRLRATNSARRNRTRSVSRRHRLTSLTMNGMDAVIQIRNRAVKGFSIYADKSRGCAARSPLRASLDAFHSTPKIRKREVVPVNQGFLCGANLCGAARRRLNCTARRMGRAKRNPSCGASAY